MAYSNVGLALRVESIGGITPRQNVWVYSSADTYATVKVAGYISDAVNQGMLVGDIIFVYDTTTPAMTAAWVTAVVAGTGATLSTGATL